MILKKAILFIVFIAAAHTVLYAQDDFCDAITTIMRDAPNKFRNIKGKELNSGMNAITWACGIKVPGTINSRFVASMGLFYEGALLQTKNKDEIRGIYDRYLATLNTCLSTLGYKMSSQENFYPGLKEYRKIIFMPTIKDNATVADIPAHITLEATYSKDVGYYTIIMYIFEH